MSVNLSVNRWGTNRPCERALKLAVDNHSTCCWLKWHNVWSHESLVEWPLCVDDVSITYIDLHRMQPLGHRCRIHNDYSGGLSHVSTQPSPIHHSVRHSIAPCCRDNMVSHHMTQYHKYNLITQRQQRQGMIPKPQSSAQKPTTGSKNLHGNFQQFSKKYSTSMQRNAERWCDQINHLLFFLDTIVPWQVKVSMTFQGRYHTMWHYIIMGHVMRICHLDGTMLLKNGSYRVLILYTI